jgi:hypothetical protein
MNDKELEIAWYRSLSERLKCCANCNQCEYARYPYCKAFSGKSHYLVAPYYKCDRWEMK